MKLALVAVAAFLVFAITNQAQSQGSPARYQFVTARTDSVVEIWRGDTMTGEITGCTFIQEAFKCTSLSK